MALIKVVTENDIGNGLEINERGQLAAKKIVPVTTFDKGSGSIVHNSIIIDYGNGIIEFSGRVVVSCTLISNSVVTTSPYKNMEGRTDVDLTSLKLKQLVSVNLTAGEINGIGSKEGAWLIREPIPNPLLRIMTIGGQIVGDPNKPNLDVFFTIKGIKA